MNAKQALVLVCAITNVLSAAVTINEFHYDNSGSDKDEFIEIVLTNPLVMSPDDIDVFFYNGGDGTPYKAFNLVDFDAHGILSDTNAYYSKLVSGIQNGGPDGFALTYSDTVVEFISYEGSFLGTSGPAAGMTSLDTLAHEPTSTLLNSSLQRQCFGETWLLTEGFNTRGQVNTGCSSDPSPVPVPGAGLLTCVGLGMIGMARKRR
ncbi:MAG: hypothetical protein GY809_03090 [Planctomycetes bacterium]|nr:hypothetical protein [Planctomycetota bacterium]